MANCLSKENRIFEEWILRDETNVIRQLGYDVHAIVEQQARALLERGLAEDTTVETARTRGQYAPEPYQPRAEGRFDVEDFVRDTYHEIWNRRMINRVEDRFSPSHVCYTNSNRMLVGTPDRIGAILGLFAMFPDATVVVDQVYGNGDDAQGYHIAVRWTLTGTHTGYGPFGEPSNARVQVMALSQHHIKHGKFTTEYTLLDEMGMLRRIAVQRLRANTHVF